MITFLNGNLVNAKEYKPERVQAYYTTEDILLAIIKPKLDKIVSQQYGKQMVVNPLRFYDVAIMEKALSIKGKDKWEGWFQVELSILVGDPSENPKRDSVTLKIDAPNVGGDAHHIKTNEINDIKVELVKYIKGN
ncbi:DUF3888 domain-containing protein [Gottfriedia sp. NPDC056225]|uniref:DUF3888 domain-containing protein n=1 Tax=Gottfriedia sp. NPDC056225 TaxID=3345751 RepID=UPI0035DC9652